MFSELGWSNPWLMATVVNTILLAIALVVPQKLLTLGGLANAWLLGVIIWGTLGLPGYLLVLFYFLVGSGVTKVGLAQKEASGIAEKRSGARGPENVWGSALIGAICALAIFWLPDYRSLLILGYVASFSTKLSDTTASEIGKAYGKTTFLITTFKPVPRGTEGAVSLEGTLAGIVASVALALVAWGVGLITPLEIIFCVIAAFFATTIESLIGATLQSQYTWLTNELVNVINTFFGAIIAIALGFLG